MSADVRNGQGEFQQRSITRLRTAVAVGSVITVGLSIFLLLGVVYQQSGPRTPASYGLTIFFFLVPILATAERAGATLGKGGLYNLSRSSQSIALSFTTGWLLLGGLLMLLSLFAWEGGLALQRMLVLIFDFQVDNRWLSILTLFLVLPRIQSRSGRPWRKRTILVYLAILILIVVIIGAWRIPLVPAPVYVYFPSTALIDVIPYLLVSLWSLHFVIDHRDELRRPGRGILAALLLPILVGAVLGALLGWTIIQYPTLFANDYLPLVTLANEFHPFLSLSILLGMFVFAIIGSNESLSSALKLATSMTRDGFLPGTVSIRRRSVKSSKVLLILLTAGTIGIVIFSPSLTLIFIGTVCLLLVMALIHMPDLLRRRPQLPENRWLRMPFHPLFPLLTVVLSVTGIVLLPPVTMLYVLLWLIAGAVYYALHAREGAVGKRQDEEMVSISSVPARKTSYRILAAVGLLQTSNDILRLSMQLAQARGGMIIALHIIPAAERDQETEQRAQAALQQLADSITALEPPPDIVIVPQVRLARTVSEGILTTLWELQIDSVILDWLGSNTVDTKHDETTAHVVRNAQSQVIVLRGSWPANIHRVLVPTVSTEHSPAGLILAKNLVNQNEPHEIVAMEFISEKASSSTESNAHKQLESILAKLDDSSAVECRVTRAANIESGITSQAVGYDLLLMGLSDRGFLAPTEFSGVAVATARTLSSPVLLIAGQENILSYWLRRTRDELTSIIPALTKQQQSTVSAAMQLNAKVSIDFHVLISLATAIAFLGLIQNSAAVIIGAMLVAPLMNPILAMAHGIVKGRLNMLREAANTTINGIIFAVTIGILLTFVLVAFGYPLNPTVEILARTKPNFLDLLVALASGAVAAYAVSRSEVAGALPGVAIAAALVPPLAVVGYGLGTAQFDIAGGSLLLFLTNLAAIVFAAALVFLILGFRPPPRIGREEQARFGMKIAVIALLIISLPLLLATHSSSIKTTRDTAITNIVERFWSPSQAQVINVEITDVSRDEVLVNVTIYDYSGAVSDSSLARLQVRLSENVNEEVTLLAETINARQDNFDSERSAQQLTQTPTPTFTPTPTLENGQPPPSETPLPRLTKTAVPTAKAVP